MERLVLQQNRNTAPIADHISKYSTTNNDKSWKKLLPKKSSCSATVFESLTANGHEETRISSPSLVYIRVHSWLILFGRERGDDFFEAWVASQRVPPRQQLQLAIAELAWWA